MEEVQNWTDMSYGGVGEQRIIANPPFGILPWGTPYFGRRTVRKGFQQSSMALIDYFGPAWVHISNPTIYQNNG
jgi:hypothetical protein